MERIYIVVKKRPLQKTPSNCGKKDYMNTITFNTNEAVFNNEKDALIYINDRKKSKDRDDKGCEFIVEPWVVQNKV